MKLKFLIVFFLTLLPNITLSGNSYGDRLTKFKQALPGYKYKFPRDFYSHDDFKLEWWYYTGNLHTEDKKNFGYQLTFFRVALNGVKQIPNPSRWGIGQIYFAHLTVTDIESQQFYFYERINRKAMNTAGARSDQFLVWNEDWILTERNGTHRLKAIESGTGIDLSLNPLKKLVFHGEKNLSRKGSAVGNASHYFSYTRIASKGKVWVRGKVYKVKGISWMDHEFSSNQLSQNQIGWDWFSLQLDNQTEIMLYQIRLKDGGIEPYSSGTIIKPNGSSRKLKLSEFKIRPLDHWISKITGIRYPSKWIVSIIGEDIRLEISPNVLEQELHHLRSIAGSYWEGSVQVQGKFRGQTITGSGYIELVGYDKPLYTGTFQSRSNN